MDHRILTAAEMEQLESYVGYRCGRLVEVYVETLDHLASSIEEQWATTPGRPFAEALRRAEASLGEKGIKGLIERRRSLWYEEAARRFRASFRRTWQGPGLPITLLIGWSFYRLLQQGYAATALSHWSYIILMVIFLTSAGMLAWRQWRRRRRYLPVEALLLFPLFLSTSFYSLLLGLPTHLPRPDWLGDGALAAALAFFILIMYLLVVRLLLEAWQVYREREREMGGGV